jgi:DNA-binding transcriptional LysR family regulator
MLGVQLFVRGTRGVTLTEAGKRVLEEARLTLGQAERTRLVGRHAGRGEVGSIALGYILGPSVGGVVSTALAEFRRSHPDVSFTLQKSETLPQLKALAEGTLDVGFMRTPGARGRSSPPRSCGGRSRPNTRWPPAPGSRPSSSHPNPSWRIRSSTSSFRREVVRRPCRPTALRDVACRASPTSSRP